jgi:hypothetical protein
MTYARHTSVVQSLPFAKLRCIGSPELPLWTCGHVDKALAQLANRHLRRKLAPPQPPDGYELAGEITGDKCLGGQRRRSGTDSLMV